MNVNVFWNLVLFFYTRSYFLNSNWWILSCYISFDYIVLNVVVLLVFVIVKRGCSLWCSWQVKWVKRDYQSFNPLHNFALPVMHAAHLLRHYYITPMIPHYYRTWQEDFRINTFLQHINISYFLMPEYIYFFNIYRVSKLTPQGSNMYSS